MGKPTGGKNGAPKKPNDEQLKYELFHEEHTGQDWDSLFDLYNYFEERNAPANLLSEIERLIESSADADTLQIKYELEELAIALGKTKSLNRQDQLLGSLRMKFIKQRKTSKDEELNLMLSKVIGSLDGLREPSSLLSRKDIEAIYDSVGKIKPSESLWIMKFLDSFAKKAFETGYFVCKTSLKAKTLSTILVPGRLREESVLLGIAYEVFEKVFRSATYDQYRSRAEKKGYLTNSFYLYFSDQQRRLYLETDTEENYGRWIEGGMSDFTPPKRKLPPKKKKSA